MIKFFKLHNNRKGFTLAEVMISVAVMGVISLVIMQMMKSQAVSKVDSKIETDALQLKTELQGILNHPAHCNANFRNKAGGGWLAVTDVYKCNTTVAGGCRTTGAAVAETQFTRNSTNWVGTYTDRVRVRTLRTRVADIDPPGGTSPVALTTMELEVTIQKRPLSLTAPLKEQTFVLYTTGVYNGTTVTGCPRTLNSTVVY